MKIIEHNLQTSCAQRRAEDTTTLSKKEMLAEFFRFISTLEKNSNEEKSDYICRCCCKSDYKESFNLRPDSSQLSSNSTELSEPASKREETIIQTSEEKKIESLSQLIIQSEERRSKFEELMVSRLLENEERLVLRMKALEDIKKQSTPNNSIRNQSNSSEYSDSELSNTYSSIHQNNTRAPTTRLIPDQLRLQKLRDVAIQADDEEIKYQNRVKALFEIEKRQKEWLARNN